MDVTTDDISVTSQDSQPNTSLHQSIELSVNDMDSVVIEKPVYPTQPVHNLSKSEEKQFGAWTKRSDNPSPLSKSKTNTKRTRATSG